MGVYQYGRTLPEFVKRYREEMELSQGDLGDMLGVHGQYVSNIERGFNKNSVAFCKRLMPHLTRDRQTFLVELLAYEVANEVSVQVMSGKRKRKR